VYDVTSFIAFVAIYHRVSVLRGRKEQETKSFCVREESEDSKAHPYDIIATLRYFRLKNSTSGVWKD